MMNEKHEKRKALIDKYCHAIPNYPNIHPQIVVDALPHMWSLMEEQDVTPEGMHYNQFVQQVLNAFTNLQAQMQMEELMSKQKERIIIPCTVSDAPKKEETT